MDGNCLRSYLCTTVELGLDLHASRHVLGSCSSASLLRAADACSNGCYGSATASYPALLPLLSLIVQAAGLKEDFAAETLGSILTGWSHLISTGTVGGDAAAEAAAKCYRECWLFTLSKVTRQQWQSMCSSMCLETDCPSIYAAVAMYQSTYVWSCCRISNKP